MSTTRELRLSRDGQMADAGLWGKGGRAHLPERVSAFPELREPQPLSDFRRSRRPPNASQRVASHQLSRLITCTRAPGWALSSQILTTLRALPRPALEGFTKAFRKRFQVPEEATSIPSAGRRPLNSE